MTATPNQVIAPPVGTPLPFGILSAAAVADQTDPSRWALGTVYEADFCGAAEVTEGACRVADWGTISVSVGTTRNATLTVTGNPAGAYDVDWGDGTVVTGDTTPSGNTRTYASNGVKVVTVTGPDGYLARVNVTVTNGSATGPFTDTAVHQNVPQTGIEQVVGFPFAAYSSFACKAVGGWERGEARARLNVLAGEGRAVETVLAHQFALDTDGVDLTPTPGTAVHPVQGLSILEGWAAQNYPYVPIIHAPRSVGTLLAAFGSLSRQGQRLETVQGARVASGGGYEGQQGPDTTDPAAGAQWVYVTGQVQLYRAADVNVVRQIDPSTNDMIALAQRPYVASWECILGAVLVKSDYAVPTT